MVQKYKIILLMLSLIILVNGQNANQVIIGSKSNTIEITVSNSTPDIIDNVIIKLKDQPQWILTSQNEKVIKELGNGEQKKTIFTFEIGYNAPTDTTFNLKYTVTTTNGENWSKKIPMHVTVPKEYSLSQNYPNPFNPITNINYELPLEANVKLKIFNITGQEVANLVNAEQPAGIHNVLWNASSYASGTYFYILNAKDKFGDRSFKKKMTIIK